MALNNASKFICRSCRDGFRQRNTVSTRQLSSTRCLRKGGIPSFQPSSSTELDTLLADIRSKVFLPSYLNRQQMKLVRSNKLKAQLENDPVYATIGEEEIRLEHLDVTKDQPPKTVILQALDLSKDSKDWQNLPALLEGWHHARPKMKETWYAKVIHKANQAGMMSVLIQCLWQVERNGFSMAKPIVRERILLAIRQNARLAAWEEEVTEKSLKQVQTVLELMEKPEHCGSRTVTDADPRAEPYVIGVALELAASQAKAQYGGEDKDGMVSIYTNRLITALGQQNTELSQSDIWSELEGRYQTVIAALDRLVQKHIPVTNGLKLALEVLGTSLSEGSRNEAEKYHELINERLDLASSTALKRVKNDQATHDPEARFKIWSIEEWTQSRGK